MNDEFNKDLNEEYNKEVNQYTSQSTLEVIDTDAVVTDVDVAYEKPKKKHRKVNGLTKIVAAALLFGVVAGASFQGFNHFTNGNNNSANPNGLIINGTGNDSQASDIANNIESAQVDENNLDDVVAVETGTSQGTITSDVSTVVENVMPSIVAINSVVSNQTSDMFGRQYSEDVEGSGSGIIIGQNDSEILIVTNNHVVENAKSVEIVFADESTVTATIKGTAPSSDLAVVSVKISDLKEETLANIKVATLGDSDTTKLGEMAIAIGNALGYGQSVTVGYISALDREVTIDGVTLSLIQTDAAINPGNSGGALLNSNGEVIGINSVKYVDDSVESIGYSIPISDAIPIINDLMNRTALAEDEMAYLGIGGEDVTDVYAQGFNMPVGIYVGVVNEGTAAEKAGIKVGDVIVSLNNTAVETMTDLQDLLSNTKAGSSGTITVQSLENGKYVEKVLDLTFDSRPVSD